MREAEKKKKKTKMKWKEKPEKPFTLHLYESSSTDPFFLCLKYKTREEKKESEILLNLSL